MSDSKNSTSHTLPQYLYKIWRFYYEGFRSMTIGKSLWLLILVKLFLLFVVLRLFFFPNVLKEQYDNDADRASAVRTALTEDRIK